jgi:hypothetical protein
VRSCSFVKATAKLLKTHTHKHIHIHLVFHYYIITVSRARKATRAAAKSTKAALKARDAKVGFWHVFVFVFRVFLVKYKVDEGGAESERYKSRFLASLCVLDLCVFSVFCKRGT